MEVLQQWVIPLIAIISPIVMVAINVTRKDTVLEGRNTTIEAIMKLQFESMATVTNLRFDDLRKDIQLILTNHLPHMDEKMNALSSRSENLMREIVQMQTAFKIHLNTKE